jgi:hypothetical protein
MAKRRKERLPFKTTPVGVAVVIVAFIASLGFFWAAAAYGDIGCFLAGGSYLGGAIGTIVGQWFRDERGGTAQMGAFIGTLAGPFVVTALFFAVLVAIWIWLGCPSV